MDAKDALAAANGLDARVEVLADRVSIKREGRSAKKFGNLTEIPIQQLAFLRFKSGWTGGYIQFVPTGQENAGRWTLPREYEVSFHADQKQAFEALKLATEQRIGKELGKEASETIPRSEAIRSQINELQAELQRALEEEAAQEDTKLSDATETKSAEEYAESADRGSVTVPLLSLLGERQADNAPSREVLGDEL